MFFQNIVTFSESRETFQSNVHWRSGYLLKSINEQANVEVRKLLLSLWFVVTDGGAAPKYSNNDTKQVNV